MYIVLVVIIVAVIIAFLVIVASKSKKLPPAVLQKIKKHWTAISHEKDNKKAILEADKLLDYVLKKKGYSGSLGEKLKKAPTLFTNINHVWFAHKLRNKIAHEIDCTISDHDANKAKRAFHKALKDLNAL